jgi:hypothetical protein
MNGENFASIGIEPQPRQAVRDAIAHLKKGPCFERLRATTEFSLAALMQYSLDNFRRRIVRLGAELIGVIERREFLLLLWKLSSQIGNDFI